MRLAFDADMVAKALAKFKPEELEGMQVLLDTDTRKLTIEVVGLKDAQALLERYGAMSRYCRKKDIIEWAGALLLTLEEERGIWAQTEHGKAQTFAPQNVLGDNQDV